MMAGVFLVIATIIGVPLLPPAQTLQSLEVKSDRHPTTWYVSVSRAAGFTKRNFAERRHVEVPTQVLEQANVPVTRRVKVKGGWFSKKQYEIQSCYICKKSSAFKALTCAEKWAGYLLNTTKHVGFPKKPSTLFGTSKAKIARAEQLNAKAKQKTGSYVSHPLFREVFPHSYTDKRTGESKHVAVIKEASTGLSLRVALQLSTKPLAKCNKPKEPFDIDRILAYSPPEEEIRLRPTKPRKLAWVSPSTSTLPWDRRYGEEIPEFKSPADWDFRDEGLYNDFGERREFPSRWFV